MDVHCTRCLEPYDSYHMRHDAIWETNLPDSWKKNWDGKLIPIVRDAFAQEGWQFGNSVYVILQCPSCQNKPETPASKQRAQMAKALSEVLGDDEDGLISELNDLGDHFMGVDGE